MDLEIFGVDKKSEIEGVWYEVGDSSFLVARHGNPTYNQLLRSKIRPNQVTINSGTVEGDKILEQITNEALAEAILLDWKNVTDEGKPVEYSTENVLMMFEKYPEFRNLIADFAGQTANYRTARLEKTVKN